MSNEIDMDRDEELAALRKELAALREEVAVLRAVQAGAFNGDRHEVAATTPVEAADAEVARFAAHMRVCSGSSAVTPCMRSVYRGLAESAESLIHARRQEVSELASALDLPTFEDVAVSLLREDMDADDPEEQP